MANWFDSAWKTASEAADNVGKNISKTTSSFAEAASETANSIGKGISATTSGFVANIQGLFPFSEEETLAFFATLFAVAAADGKIDEDELIMILSSPEADKLSTEGKKKLQSYSYNPPSLEEAIKRLSKADQELKFGLVFYILNLVWVDGVMTPEEEAAIKIAQREFEINDVQVKAIEDFTKVLAQTHNEQTPEVMEQVKAATKRMEKVGIPIKALAHSQDDPTKNIEYSDEEFWEKIKAFGLQAGKGLVEQALVLWYTLHDPNIPNDTKMVIIAALAYLILPIDMIPDVLPAVGFTDDLSVIAAAITAIAGVAMGITPEAKAKAKKQTEEIFSGKEILRPESLDPETIDIAHKAL